MYIRSADRLIDTYNAAKLLHLTPRMVRYLAARGLLAGIRRGPKLLYFERDRVLIYARTREVNRAE
jgi:hypothetical protein